MALRALTVTGDPLQVESELARLLGSGHRRQLLFGEETRLDAHRELDLFGRVQQRNLSDLLEVILDRVGRRAGDLRGVDRDVLVVVRRDDDRAGRQRLGELRLAVVVVLVVARGIVVRGGGGLVFFDDVIRLLLLDRSALRGRALGGGLRSSLLFDLGLHVEVGVVGSLLRPGFVGRGRSHVSPFTERQSPPGHFGH